MDGGSIRRRSYRLGAAALSTLLIGGACSTDREDNLPSVTAEAVPTGEPQPGPNGTLTFDSGCVRVGDTPLVFVDGEVSLRYGQGDNSASATPRHLEFNYRDDGAGHLSLLPLGQTVPELLGFQLQRHGGEWAAEPPAGCDGPWFLVVSVAAPQPDGGSKEG